jgi:sugar/nucleoside kinase (ribokinase family)
MTGTTLALLLRPADKEGPHEEGTTDEEEVHILTKVGPDFAGNTLLEFYRRAGASTSLVLTDDAARTSMAVLPVWKNGKRGCFVNLACNDGFTVDEILEQVDHGVASIVRPPRAFLFGYPHLMPRMQGRELRSMLRKARHALSSGGRVLIGVDLNGVDGSDPGAAREVLIPALSEIDVLHLNEDEAMVLSSSSPTAPTNENDGLMANDVSPQLLSQIAAFHEHGCAVVLLSLGSKGAFVSVTPDSQRLQQLSSAASDAATVALSQWTPGTQVHVPAFQIPHGEINANGAGDALFSGFCLAASSWGGVMERQICQNEEWKVTPQVAGTFASLVAWQRCDAKTRDGDNMKSAVQLVELIRQGNLPDALERDNIVAT